MSFCIARTGRWPSRGRRQAVDLAWRTLYAVAVHTYARSNELAALSWDDVDLAHNVIHIAKSVDRAIHKVKSTKSGTTRRIPIEPALRPVFSRLGQERDGKPAVLWMPDHEDRAILLRQHLELAGVRREELFTSDARRRHITFHDLRATGITWAAVRGDDPLRIKQRAGHLGFSTTKIYIREAENLREGFGEVFPVLPPELTGVRLGQVTPLHAEFPANMVEQRGIEHPPTGAPIVVDRRVDDAKEATKDDQRRREVSALSDVVEAALARAIDAEVNTRSPGWEARVALLATELKARRLAGGGVVALDVKRRCGA